MGARLLLVDDHELLREGLATMLESRPDLEVVGQAGNGRDAVELATGLAPDITIMDIWMPHLSGAEATAEIVRRNPGARIIILSVHEKQAMVTRCFRAGAKGYVVKSACSRELFEAIDVVGSGRSYLSPAVTQSMVEAIGAAGHDDGPAGISSLTPREREVLQLIGECRSNKEIARELHISTRTVESHRSALMRKLRVNNVSSLVRIAIREELVAP